MAQFYSHQVRKKTNKTRQLDIDSLDGFGQGVAKYQGKTIFVENALPGEKVEVVLTEDKKNYAHGRVLRYLSKSAERLVPSCQVYEQCGGCSGQHIPLSLQHQSKGNALISLFKRFSHSAVTIESCITGVPYHYRRRARLSLYYDKKQQRLLMGFRQAGSNQILMIKDCPILCEQLNEILSPLYSCLSALQVVAFLGHVELIQADNGAIIVLRHLKPLVNRDRDALISFAQRHGIALFLLSEKSSEAIWQKETPYLRVEGVKMEFNPLHFIQVNAQVNLKMVSKACQWLDLTKKDRILDLFCGMGNFSLPMAQQAGYVMGVEGVAEQVIMARHNAELNHILNAEFAQCNLDEPLLNQHWAKMPYTKILLDPARAGALEVMAFIVKVSPTHVVYVSCNPATLVRDSKVLLENGYAIEKVTILDMFPQTEHVESMILFRKYE